ncbi:glycosyltransferase family 4 protein [Clostridium perfringens]|uniref:glycosyltransferase family 4 protein n=1 Tax=Clostridium perfringens TaxID=1502 RepID=UPI0018E426AD|nr:glycosyltransferase family 4 protein [Clostridium perfringens]MBI6001462.1 glycosyltransferase family 4 protein [Clostridium perfringens]MDK0557887.1 glycosyltransferase family 4 protein [Clostridium perfringens]MDZ4956703.1 glycosyltransferase [Clostridium perfringens]
MNILYLTISNLNMGEHGIYQDLIKELISNGHNVTIVMANEEKYLKKTSLNIEEGIDILRVKVGNQFGVSFIKKGISNLFLENQFKKSINKFLNNKEFDLILYATPPVTFSGVVEFCKKKYNATTYLMLKDIFPQNAVDIGLFKKYGLIYNIFKKKEENLYKNSDWIGCMSKKNIEYLLEHNKWLDSDRVEMFPNAIYPCKPKKHEETESYRTKLNIPKDKILYVFGGNLGKPQGINFLIKAIKSVSNDLTCHFIIVGSGSEEDSVKIEATNMNNLTFIKALPRDKYESLIKECDIGIISLDHRFTIPNYPSRILSYMDKGIPILACTDKNTDIKELVEEEAKCGKWCYSNNIEDFKNCLEYFRNNKENLKKIGLNGRRYLENNFNVKSSIEILERHFK